MRTGRSPAGNKDDGLDTRALGIQTLAEAIDGIELTGRPVTLTILPAAGR
ncbi:hypothetical protein ACFFK0_27170 [Paenibacillus chartarius]|uniref:Uncharacterized protein n=1 Tax=Paenibacillus chartarius TaxID=747481 RepID=A0ABV6DTW7_9BACL